MGKKYIKTVVGLDGKNHGVMSEADTRRRLISTARMFGYEKEIIQILDKTDALLKNCTNPQERLAIAEYGALEIHKFLGGGGDLEVNGKKIY